MYFDFRGLRRYAGFMHAALLVVGGVLIALVLARRESEIDRARENYRAEATAQTSLVANETEQHFSLIYQALRTIARLPGVRRIDRHARNFDDNARQTVQEIYNNLAQNVNISEVYILPADFDPERIDPATGALEKPIIDFDQLIIGRNADLDQIGRASWRERV